MILTVTLNPAWDVTYAVEHLEPGMTIRADSAAEQPGGKGVNASRVLLQLGYRTLATGLVAGEAGRRLREALAAGGVPEAFVPCDAAAGQTRRTLTVVESGSGRATMLAEPGPTIGDADWKALIRRLDDLLTDADAVVFSGSLPRGAPPDAYATLVQRAHAHDVPAIVDADGAALAAALPARPDLVKPNAAELSAATGERDLVSGARRLLSAGAARVVVSAGSNGLTGLDGEGRVWRAIPAPLRPVNPTGAGDAAAAALAAGIAGALAWPDLLRCAVSWSAAAVLEPRAGTVAADAIAELAHSTTVTAVESTEPDRPSNPDRPVNTPTAPPAPAVATAHRAASATTNDGSVPQC